MYIDLYDSNSYEGQFGKPGQWKYFNITPQNCRRRKGAGGWNELSITLPEVRVAFPNCPPRFNICLTVPQPDISCDCFSAVTYIRYCLPWMDKDDTDVALHRVFCTNAEMEAFISFRFPKDAKSPAFLEDTLTGWRNYEYRDKEGKLLPGINIPEPYRSRLYSGAFNEPWSAICL